MIHAYDEIYLEDAMNNFAVMLDMVLKPMKVILKSFTNHFLLLMLHVSLKKAIRNILQVCRE